MQIKYYEYYKDCKDISKTRLEMVKYALNCGIKPSARKFGVTVKIVKKWINRYNEGGREALKDKEKKPKHFSNEILPYWRFKIIDLCKKAREKNETVNMSQIKKEHAIPYSIPTIKKVIVKSGYSDRINKKQRRSDSFEKTMKMKKKNETDEIVKLYREYIQYILR